MVHADHIHQHDEIDQPKRALFDGGGEVCHELSLDQQIRIVYPQNQIRMLCPFFAQAEQKGFVEDEATGSFQPRSKM